MSRGEYYNKKGEIKTGINSGGKVMYSDVNSTKDSIDDRGH